MSRAIADIPAVPRRFDTVVVGGGVIGLACAHFLAEQGQRVCVVDAGPVSRGASHANCGLVFVSDLPPLCSPGAVFKELARMARGASPLSVMDRPTLSRFLWLARFAANCRRDHLFQAMVVRHGLLQESLHLYQQLVDQGVLRCQWRRQGVLMVFRDRRALDDYQTVNRLLEPYGLAAEALGPDELVRFEPALGQGLAGAWYHRADAHLRPDLLVDSWRAHLRAKGVALLTGRTVAGFEARGRRLRRAVTSRGNLQADRFVLAAGAWSPALARPLGLRLPVQPAKGYSITTSRPDPCPSVPCYLVEASVVATPFVDGLRLGGTLEFSRLDERKTPGRLERIVQSAAGYLRRPVGKTVIQRWMAPRPMSADDLPIIGPAPGLDNLYLATGHGMMGISMAPATGRRLAEAMGS